MESVMNFNMACSILGVCPSATVAEIKKAYKKKAIKNHPDKGGSTEAMASINEAKEVAIKWATYKEEKERQNQAARAAAATAAKNQETTQNWTTDPLDELFRQRDVHKWSKIHEFLDMIHDENLASQVFIYGRNVSYDGVKIPEEFLSAISYDANVNVHISAFTLNFFQKWEKTFSQTFQKNVKFKKSFRGEKGFYRVSVDILGKTYTKTFFLWKKKEIRFQEILGKRRLLVDIDLLFKV